MSQLNNCKIKQKFGQYFTPPLVAEFMVDLAEINSQSKILEPACGQGIFLSILESRGFHNITAYEIDPTLATEYEYVKNESFVSTKITDKFDLVIGNPPYIRWKNLETHLKKELECNHLWIDYSNSLCDYSTIFILKSIESLKNEGQLIFICPEYWMTTTHSVKLRNYMCHNGVFKEIFHFKETPIFDKVTVSTIIFKYVKSTKDGQQINIYRYNSKQRLSKSTLLDLKKQQYTQDTSYFTISHFQCNERWILYPESVKIQINKLVEKCHKTSQGELFQLSEARYTTYNTIGDVCDIGNGLVSGCDRAFQLNQNSISEYENKHIIRVIKAKHLQPFFIQDTIKYIFIDYSITESELRQKLPNFFNHLQPYKQLLENRYRYNRDIPYWEWVFLRNFTLFSRPEPRICVPCKERVSHKNYVRFAFVPAGIYPTQDVTAIFRKTGIRESIEYILAYLNLPIIFAWLKFNGIVKGDIVEFSEKPIASIPVRLINWQNQEEIQKHEEITDLVKTYLSDKQDHRLQKVNYLLNQLLEEANAD